MSYFEDLSPYTYSAVAKPMLNVGWLSSTHPFPRGAVPLAFAHELALLTRSEPSNLTRGFHVCEFCRAPTDILEKTPEYEEVWEMFRSGNGEVHIQGENGQRYAAPSLVVHYVSEHQYQPPSQFIEAVLFQRRKRASANQSA
jgi:hypothetical protein